MPKQRGVPPLYDYQRKAIETLLAGDVKIPSLLDGLPWKPALPPVTGDATAEDTMTVKWPEWNDTLDALKLDLGNDRDLWRHQYMQKPKWEPETGSLAELLERFTYKPGWEFQTWQERGITLLKIIVEVVDADNPKGHPIRITFNTSVDHTLLNIRGEKWTKWLREQIIYVETHEVDEFFQIDGHKPFDPH